MPGQELNIVHTPSIVLSCNGGACDLKINTESCELAWSPSASLGIPMSISDVTMNKQIRGCSSYPGPRAYWDLDEEAYSASPPPEISIYPAADRFPLEIDEDTGLPKLPVEPPVPGSPEVVRSQLDHKKLASALKMSSGFSPTKRKSVTFNSEASNSPVSSYLLLVVGSTPPTCT